MSGKAMGAQHAVLFRAHDPQAPPQLFTEAMRTNSNCQLAVPHYLWSRPGIAMAVIGDTALSLDLWPDGFIQGVAGRTYHSKTGGS
jgi:hypothetical protein